MNENNVRNIIVRAKQKEEEVYSFLSKGLEGAYTVVRPQEGRDVGYDIAIFRNMDLLAIVEIKLSLPLFEKRIGVGQWYFSVSHKYQARCYVITDGEEYWVYDKRKNEPEVLSPKEFIKSIKSDYQIDEPIPDVAWVVKRIASLASRYQLEALSQFAKRHIVSFEFDRVSGAICFLKGFEDRFFKKLLPQDRGLSDMCRFTTLDSAFKMLKDSRQNMCNILCMNDRSEGVYADRKVFDEIPGFRREAFDESDHCYILSLMDATKADDLTMWRLYGDSAKGVCISYKQRDIDKQKKIADPFFLGKVSYGKLKKDGGEEHKELDFLRDLTQEDFGGGWRFKFRRWGIWKHFFKSYHFSDEKEIRLLYYDRNDDREQFEWIKNSESQIITKMQLFSVDDFPLEVKKILVGPKNPELDIVCRQMQLLADHSKKEILVKASSVTVYR